MTDYTKVAGHDGLVRDNRTKAIVNTDQAAYNAYIAQRNQRLEQQARLERHDEELNSIKADIAEIKQLLLAVLKNGG